MWLACFACRNRHVPLGKVAHCLAATLATLASDPATAQLAMQPNSSIVNALLQLITTSDDDAFAGEHLQFHECYSDDSEQQHGQCPVAIHHHQR